MEHPVRIYVVIRPRQLVLRVRWGLISSLDGEKRIRAIWLLKRITRSSFPIIGLSVSIPGTGNVSRSHGRNPARPK